MATKNSFFEISGKAPKLNVRHVAANGKILSSNGGFDTVQNCYNHIKSETRSWLKILGCKFVAIQKLSDGNVIVEYTPYIQAENVCSVIKVKDLVTKVAVFKPVVKNLTVKPTAKTKK